MAQDLRRTAQHGAMAPADLLVRRWSSPGRSSAGRSVRAGWTTLLAGRPALGRPGPFSARAWRSISGPSSCCGATPPPCCPTRTARVLVTDGPVSFFPQPHLSRQHAGPARLRPRAALGLAAAARAGHDRGGELARDLPRGTPPRHPLRRGMARPTPPRCGGGCEGGAKRLLATPGLRRLNRSPSSSGSRFSALLRP